MRRVSPNFDDTRVSVDLFHAGLVFERESFTRCATPIRRMDTNGIQLFFFFFCENCVPTLSPPTTTFDSFYLRVNFWLISFVVQREIVCVSKFPIVTDDPAKYSNFPTTTSGGRCCMWWTPPSEWCGPQSYTSVPNLDSRAYLAILIGAGSRGEE